jgi:hypothetical protein
VARLQNVLPWSGANPHLARSQESNNSATLSKTAEFITPVVIGARANLNGPNGPTHFYLHGNDDYFTSGRTYTHGCTTEPAQTVLKESSDLAHQASARELKTD